MGDAKYNIRCRLTRDRKARKQKLNQHLVETLVSRRRK